MASGKVEEKVMNRTATFAFMLGNNFFGTIVAMVPGEDAKYFSFTSSYPVQLLKTLSPVLEPMLKHDTRFILQDLPAEKFDSTIEKHEEGVYEMNLESQLDSLKEHDSETDLTSGEKDFEEMVE